MSDNDVLDLFANEPDMIRRHVDMPEPNSPIEIYKGDIVLKHQGKELIVKNAEIYFEWFPFIGAKFNGTIEFPGGKFERIDQSIEYIASAAGLEIGTCYINHFSITNLTPAVVKGKFFQEVVFGDKSIPVDKVLFTIPNFRDFFGTPVKIVSGKRVSSYMNRLVLEDEQYTIIIDKQENNKVTEEALLDKGGYIIQYAGEITKKKDAIKYQEVEDLCLQLHHFLSFLNGRKTSPLFLKGTFEGEEKWSDYSGFGIDIFRPVNSWPPQIHFPGLKGLWYEFSQLWENESDRDFLMTAIHWYVEANKNSGYVQGALVMAQTALELIYNWLLIEKKRILVGRDAENINASNKMRLLLSHLGISYNVPDKLKELKAFVNNEKDIDDAPDAITLIRNAIIHSQEEKRKRLHKIEGAVKAQALWLSITYIELSLLFILKYNGKFFDRCSGAEYAGGGERYVPWSKEPIVKNVSP